jgi:hypothetical protein
MRGEARMTGGPSDGEELDLDELFGGRRPRGLVIPVGDRSALYDLDEVDCGDLDGDCYRFRGWHGPPSR